jgi:hypothetical protein
MTSPNILPADFADLAPFVAKWSVAGTVARDCLRQESSAAERQAFYDAAQRRVVAALAYLDQKPVRDFDQSEQNLMNMMLSLTHVALAVEMQRDDEPKHSAVRRYVKITRSSADSNV